MGIDFSKPPISHHQRGWHSIGKGGSKPFDPFTFDFYETVYEFGPLGYFIRSLLANCCATFVFISTDLADFAAISPFGVWGDAYAVHDIGDISISL